MKNNLRQQAIDALIRRFPNASSGALSRMLYSENKPLFASVEAARSLVRYARGAMGNDLRGFARHRPTKHAPMVIPRGKTHLDEWEAFQIDGQHKSLILSDPHIPYHDRKAIIETLKFGHRNGADLILINGDACDFFAMSFWEKDPRKRNFKAELETTIALFRAIREAFPKARIIYKEGNHEERYERYMMTKAPELLGIDKFGLRSIFELDDLGIELIGERRPIRLGTLNVLHGHEHRAAMQNPVNPARGLFLRCKAHAICGHFHQSSHHTEKTIEDKVVGTWSTGCLCDLHPDYAPMNNWVHGFAFVEVYDSGKFHLLNKVIRDGKIY